MSVSPASFTSTVLAADQNIQEEEEEEELCQPVIFLYCLSLKP
jgi:hypothetical protein